MANRIPNAIEVKLGSWPNVTMGEFCKDFKHLRINLHVQVLFLPHHQMMIYLSREFLIQSDFLAEINPLSPNIWTFH